jgi:response regulator RpfG family c-di-GMP phosphodiesterase
MTLDAANPAIDRQLDGPWLGNTAGRTRRTVLCVDDEPGILAALKRALRAPGVTVLTAGGGAEALQILEDATVDLVISDMRMPGMDGAQLLERIHDRWPRTTRILLTGHADHSATIAAVNRGRIFRYLQKPWDDAELLASVRDGMAVADRAREEVQLRDVAESQNAHLRRLGDELQSLQRQAQQDRIATDLARQRQFLQCVRMLSTLMERRSPVLFARGQRVAALARDVGRRMALPAAQVLELFVAGLLHDIGLVGAPEQALERPRPDGADDAVAAWRRHAGESALILSEMEDMRPVAELIRPRHAPAGASGTPAGVGGEDAPLAARVLAVARAAEAVREAAAGRGNDAVCAELRRLERHGFDAAVVDAAVGVLRTRAPA